jgi:hypothetical protein
LLHVELQIASQSPLNKSPLFDGFLRKRSLPFVQKFTVVTLLRVQKIGGQKIGGNAMKRLAILTFALGVIVAPFQAHAQKPVEFNGMVFDPPPAQGYEAPKAPAPSATKSRTSTHQRHQQHHSHS